VQDGLQTLPESGAVVAPVSTASPREISRRRPVGCWVFPADILEAEPGLVSTLRRGQSTVVMAARSLGMVIA
jgi:hypothetical protein